MNEQTTKWRGSTVLYDSTTQRSTAVSDDRVTCAVAPVGYLWVLLHANRLHVGWSSG